MAEEEGFEPPIPFQVRQFSRLEPSTTRPLFRISSLFDLASRCKALFDGNHYGSGRKKSLRDLRKRLKF